MQATEISTDEKLQGRSGIFSTYQVKNLLTGKVRVVRAGSEAEACWSLNWRVSDCQVEVIK